MPRRSVVCERMCVCPGGDDGVAETGTRMSNEEGREKERWAFRIAVRLDLFVLHCPATPYAPVL